MRRGFQQRAIATGSVLALVMLVGCSSDSATRTPERESKASKDLAARQVATCKEGDRSSPTWRDDAVSLGPVGFLGPGRDFRSEAIRRPGGDLVVKLPVIVEGTTPVTLSVPSRFRRRFGIDFGDFNTETHVRQTNKIVRFEPCEHRPRTGWPGGLILKNRKPVSVNIQVGDGPVESLRVGRG